VKLRTRRTFVIVEERFEEAGRLADQLLRRVAAVAVLENPYAGRYVEDLRPMIVAHSHAPARRRGRRFRPCRSLALVLAEARERKLGHGKPIRAAIGGGESWISSFTKKGGPGTLIDIPMNHKDEIYVRSHYDGMSIVLPDAPMPGRNRCDLLHSQSRTPPMRASAD
jgi:hypothetical protein